MNNKHIQQENNQRALGDIDDELLDLAKSLPVKYRSKLDQYRHVLIELHRKFYTQREMSEILQGNGVDISQQAISQYLQRHPFTKDELKQVESGLVKSDTAKSKQTQKTKEDSKSFWKKKTEVKQHDNKKFDVDLNQPFN